jgi:hypothetical protein
MELDILLDQLFEKRLGKKNFDSRELAIIT